MQATKILRKIEKEAKKRKLPILGNKKGNFLAKFVKEAGIVNILEVGTLNGYSAIVMASQTPNVKIITIEKEWNFVQEARRNIAAADLDCTIEVIWGKAEEIIPKQRKNTFDLLFLDAEKKSYYKYLLLAENKMKPTAFVVADNVKHFAFRMENYLAKVRQNLHYRSQTVDFDNDAMEISQKIESQ